MCGKISGTSDILDESTCDPEQFIDFGEAAESEIRKVKSNMEGE